MSREEIMFAWASVVAVEAVYIDQSPCLLSRLRQQDFLMNRCRMERRKEESKMNLRLSAPMSRMMELQCTEIQEIVLEQIPERGSGISFLAIAFQMSFRHLSRNEKLSVRYQGLHLRDRFELGP